MNKNFLAFAILLSTLVIAYAWVYTTELQAQAAPIPDQAPADSGNGPDCGV